MVDDLFIDFEAKWFSNRLYLLWCIAFTYFEMIIHRIFVVSVNPNVKVVKKSPVADSRRCSTPELYFLDNNIPSYSSTVKNVFMPLLSIQFLFLQVCSQWMGREQNQTLSGKGKDAATSLNMSRQQGRVDIEVSCSSVNFGPRALPRGSLVIALVC